MFKPVIFGDEVTIETIKELVNEISNVILNTDRKIKLYFSTDGGETRATNMFIDYITSIDKNRIEIHFVESIHSCGFYIFLKLLESKMKVTINEDLTSIVHLFSYKVRSRELIDKNSIQSKILQSVNNDNKRFLNLIRPVLTKKDYKQVKNGYDICLNYNKLKKIMNKY